MAYPQFLNNPSFIANRVIRYFRFRRTVKHSLKWHHNDQDKLELARTKLPSSEKIELHCVWATEAFTPSSVDNLLSSLTKLGWDKHATNSRQNLNEWVKQGRSLGDRSSWNNGGIILRRGDTRFIAADKKYCKLPSFVDYAKLSLRNITPSLTLVTIQFVVRDEKTLAINDILASEAYKTRVKFYPNRLQAKHAAYIGVEMQKREAVKTEIGKIHHELYDWFKRNLPGYYSSLNRYDQMPMVDFITSRKYTQPNEKSKKIRGNYIDILFDYTTENWKGVQSPELELRLGRDIEKPTAHLFGKYSDLTKNPGYYSGKGRELLVHKFDDDLKVTIDLLATHNFLISQEQSLSAIRDKASSQIKGMRKAIADVSYIRNKFLSVSRDVQSIGRDIGESGISKYIYDRGETMDFTNPYNFGGKRPKLIESLQKQDESRAKALLVAERQVKEAVLSNGNIASTIANLRIQRYVFWLTIITAVFTFISISPTLSHWRGELLKWLNGR